jgi:hypothetical protein
MSPETRAFLDGVRSAEEPTVQDERRVAAALQAALGAGTLVGAGMGASKALKLFGFYSISWLKLGGLAVLGVGLWVAAAKPFARGSADEKPFARSSASAGPVSALPVATLEAPRTQAEPETLPVTKGAPERSQSAPRASAALPAIQARNGASSKSSVRPSPNEESLRREIALLEDVRSALARGDGGAALRRLDAHVTSDRQLLSERRAARVLALCLVARTGEARSAAAELLRDDPGSVQRGAVERSCAGQSPAER